MLQSLIFLYDAYVYNEFLQLYTVDHFDKQTFNLINDLHDNLIGWLKSYKEWCQGMIQLQKRYMRPLVDRLSESKSAKAELEELRTRASNAKAVLTRCVVKDVDYTEGKLVDELNLSAKKPGVNTLAKRSRARYKREHTL